MTKVSTFFQIFKQEGLEFFTGIPDSLLKDFCAYVSDHVTSENHIISANEGASVGLAIGNYLATGKIPLVYMQNSGLGNAINPLLSLADTQIYAIPMILLVGWRGEPQTQDEPQHIKQGKVTTDLLIAMDIPYEIIIGDELADSISLKKAISYARENYRPCALLVKKSSFQYLKKSKVEKSLEKKLSLSREEAIKKTVKSLSQKDIVVSTTGMTSRELFEFRESNGQNHKQDFLTVGGMGHASQIALGLALQKPDSNVYCFDGDGSSLMHLGSYAIIGQSDCKNYKHILINNGVHGSVGGQPTVGFDVDFVQIAKNCGYKSYQRCSDKNSLEKALSQMSRVSGPCFLEIIVNKKYRKNLIRPSKTTLEMKKEFMSFLEKLK